MSKVTSVYELLRWLYTSNVLTLTRIYKQLNISYDQLHRLLNIVRMLGLALKPDVMISRLGLKQVIAIAELNNRICLDKARKKVIPFVKALAYVPPNKVIVSLHVPRTAKIEPSADNYGSTQNIRIYSFDYVIRSKPKPEILRMLLHNDYASITNTKTLELLAEKPLIIDLGYLKAKAKFDFLDLKLLSKLVKEPFTTLSGLSKELNIKLRRLEAHIKHAEQLLYGYRISKISIAESARNAAIAVIKCKSNINLCAIFIQHPNVSSCVATFKNDSFMLVIRDLGNNLGLFLHNMQQFLSTISCEIIDFTMYFLNDHFFIVMTIPSVPRDLAYVPQLRSWRKDIKIHSILSKVFDVIKC